MLTRRSGGASRALFDPVIQSLRDLAAPGILLSGSPEEGPLIGNIRPALAVPGRGQLYSRGARATGRPTGLGAGVVLTPPLPPT